MNGEDVIFILVLQGCSNVKTITNYNIITRPLICPLKMINNLGFSGTRLRDRLKTERGGDYVAYFKALYKQVKQHSILINYNFM